MFPSAEQLQNGAAAALTRAAAYAREQADRVVADVQTALEAPTPRPSRPAAPAPARQSEPRTAGHPIAEGFAGDFEIITQHDVEELLRVDRALGNAHRRVHGRAPRALPPPASGPGLQALRGDEGLDPEDATLVDTKAAILDPAHGLALCEEILRGPGVPDVDVSRFDQLVAAAEPRNLSVIDRDVNRTFPSHPAFADPSGPAARSLRSILAAHSVWDPDVGYVQGMNFVAAAVLLQCEEDERRAFSFFARLLSSPTHRLRDLYLPALPGLHLRLQQFHALLHEFRPQLAAHLDALDLRPAMYAQEWFLTLFAYSLPLSLVELLTRAFVIEGWVAVMRLAVAVLDSLHDDLMAADFERAIRLFKTLQYQKESTATGDDGEEWVVVTPDTLVMTSLDLPIHTYHLERVEARLQFPILGSVGPHC